MGLFQETVTYISRQLIIPALVREHMHTVSIPVGILQLQYLLREIKRDMLSFQFTLGDDGRYHGYRDFMYISPS